MDDSREYILNLVDKLYLETIYSYKVTSDEYKALREAYEFVYLVIMDIINNEDISYDDIKVIGKGNFSRVIKIGTKVVKIGSKRSVERFSNNGYMNAMLLRHKVDISKKLSLIIEVNELVDTNIIVTEDDLYQLYKKIRDLHLIWLDVKEENVGRLIRDNKIYWRDKLFISDEVLGLDSFVGDSMLKKGELVIIDNDLIFREDDNVIMNNRCKRLEKRYMLEKGRE